jgi:hypothetical protein
MISQATPAKMTNTKVTFSEKIVTGLAVAVLLAAFATGVFAKPMNMSPHGSGSVAHVTTTGSHRDN